MRIEYLISLFLLKSVGVNSNERDEINEYIFNLNYDKKQVLKYVGEKVELKSGNEGHEDAEQNYIIYEESKRDLEITESQIGISGTSNHLVYPGALLKADHNLLANSPTPIMLKRKPLQYTIGLSGLEKHEGTFRIIPGYSKYHAALTKGLKAYYAEFAGSHDVPARIKSAAALVYSEEQFKVTFGLAFDVKSVAAQIDFQAVKNNRKTIMVQQFRQIFFDVTVGPPSEPADLFDDEETLDRVKRQIDERSPPLLVDSLLYGREIYVIIETSSVDEQAKATMEAELNLYAVDTHAEVDFGKKLKNFKIKVCVLGGSTRQIELISATNFQNVTNVIKQYGRFNAQNQGFPLTYSARFLKDNSIAEIIGKTEYPESRVKVIKAGNLIVETWLRYEVSVDITWKTVDLDKNSKDDTQMKTKRIKKNLDYGQTGHYHLPGVARNVRVKISGSFLGQDSIIDVRLKRIIETQLIALKHKFEFLPIVKVEYVPPENVLSEDEVWEDRRR